MLRTLAEVALDYDGVLVDGDALARDQSALVGLRCICLRVCLHGRRRGGGEAAEAGSKAERRGNSWP